MKKVNIYEAKTRLSQLGRPPAEEVLRAFEGDASSSTRICSSGRRRGAVGSRVEVSLLRPAFAEMGLAELPVSNDEVLAGYGDVVRVV